MTRKTHIRVPGAARSDYPLPAHPDSDRTIKELLESSRQAGERAEAAGNAAVSHLRAAAAAQRAQRPRRAFARIDGGSPWCARCGRELYWSNGRHECSCGYFEEDQFPPELAWMLGGAMLLGIVVAALF